MKLASIGSGMNRNPAFYPFMVTLAAICLLSLMDAVLKSASLAVGAYSALVLRSAISLSIAVPAYASRKPPRPTRRALRIHVVRGVVLAFMSLTFFSGLVYLPLAEALALSFISPLVALALAALILKEAIGKKSLIAAALGVAGVAIIIGGRVGRERMTDDAVLGIVLVLTSALLYAWNLVLQRQQAQMAKPLEIVTFQGIVTGLVLALGIPFFFVMPQGWVWVDIALSAVLSLAAALLMSWAYARAEAQVLVPVEYTGFAWACLFGWLFFEEAVRLTTAGGALLIIVGCWIAAPRKHTEQVATGITPLKPGDTLPTN